MFGEAFVRIAVDGQERASVEGAVFSLEGGDVLFRGYDGGILIRDLRERYGDYFAGSSWAPKGSSSASG